MSDSKFVEEGFEEEDEIITLISDEGEEIDFVEIAGIAYNDNFYVILQPAELPEGMGDDEALVFLLETTEDGEEKFSIELDDETVEAVFAEYNRLCDEQGIGEEE